MRFFLGKVGTSEDRTRTTFDDAGHTNNGIWMIPAVMGRWNRIISGDAKKEYETYLLEHIFRGKKDLRMLSPGCGAGNHELRFATFSVFREIIALDLTRDLITEAGKRAKELGLSRITFRAENIYHTRFPDNSFDVVHFHQSLHHFRNMEQFLSFIRRILKKDGLLIIYEYAGPDRFQFPDEQIAEMNRLLTTIPPAYRKKYASGTIKKRVYRPGLLRMKISDPSEAVDSGAILPVIHRHFETLEEKALGGNLLMLLLKDIAHHFIREEDAEAEKILKMLFAAEDEYLRDHPSDFVFGIYRNRK